MIPSVFDPTGILPLQRLRSAMLTALFLVQAAFTFAAGPLQEFTRSINREYNTMSNGMTALYNKYGAVNVNVWQKNTVKIDINIVVNARSQSDADRTFDRIKVNFTNTAGYIKAETFIDPLNGKGWWAGETNSQDFKINYEVWLPANNQLDLRNKYGNAYVAALNGKLMAEIKYGDLRTETLNADADLNISYGKAYLAGVNNLSGQISYGELTLNEAKGDVQLDSKYSELKLEKATNMRLMSKYDDFSLGVVNDLRIQTKYADIKGKWVGSVFITGSYTDIKINTVATALDADLTYGGLTVENLGKDFNDLNIVAKHADVKVMTEKGLRCKFRIEGSHTDIKTPQGATIRRTERNGACEVLEGFIGDSNAKSNVKGKMQYGSFVLR
jgi:hypothetical protein